MAAKPYMPFYVADYMADAAHLTTLEHGAYLLLIMTYWQTGKPLPDDDKKLCEITKLNFTNYKKIKAHLREFFFCENGKLIHKRIEKELDEFKKKSDMARLAGIKSGEVRRGKNRTDAQRTLNERSTNIELRGVVRIPLNHTDTDTDTEKSKEKNIMSGKPDDAPLGDEKKQKHAQLKKDAQEVLDFLNLKTGKNFRGTDEGVDTNLDFIIARLKANVTVQDCKSLVTRKCLEWKGGDMEQYLRPSTLFNKTKFEQYLGEMVEEVYDVRES